MSNVIVKTKMSTAQAGKMLIRNIELEKGLSNAIKAICLTRDYVGESLLPAISGWTWFDTGNEIAKLIPEDEWTKQFKLRVAAYKRRNKDE